MDFKSKPLAASAQEGAKNNYGSISSSSYPAPPQNKPEKAAKSLSCNVSPSDVTKVSTSPSLLERAAKRVPCLGILMALCASLFLGTAGMLVKMTHSVHGVQVAVFRALIQALIYGAIIVFRRTPFGPAEAEFWPVLARTLLGSASITFSYFALKLIPLGDATTIRFSLPIWTLIISYLILNEACSVFKVGAVVASITGVVLIAKPDFCAHLWELAWSGGGGGGGFNGTSTTEQTVALEEGKTIRQFEGCMMALSSSICLAMSLVALRLCRRTSVEVSILWLSIGSICIGSMLLLLINEWRLPDNLEDVAFILLNGICGSIGQWFITSAMKIEQSGILSLTRTFDIQVAFLYSAFLLEEEIRVTSLIGSALISCGVLAVAIPTWLQSRTPGLKGAARAGASL